MIVLLNANYIYIYLFKYVCIVIYAKMLLFLITSIAITFAPHAFLWFFLFFQLEFCLKSRLPQQTTENI